jgi:hypothetical protein
MNGRSASFRVRAEEAREMAKSAVSPALADAYRELACRWDALADQAERQFIAFGDDEDVTSDVIHSNAHQI